MKRSCLVSGLMAGVLTLGGCVAIPPRATQPAPLAPTPTSPPATDVIAMDAFEQNKQLGRGVNFGNALEAPNEGDWDMVLEEQFFQLARDGGFSTIRLPVRWSTHALKEAPYTIDPKFFERVDWAVNQAMSRGLNIVVNMHHYDELMADMQGQRERFIALWKQIAERYKDHPPTLLFELCNEPTNAVPPSLWNDVVAEALAEVRKTNPTRNVVIGAVDWNSISKLPELKLPAEDKHIIVTFHYYLPFQFTHQGAEWVDGSNAWLGTEWKGSGNDKAYVDFDFDKAEMWAKENQRPIWMGEFGVYSKADMDSRARWTSYVAREAEKHGFSWAYWEFGAGFGVYDRQKKQWNEPIHNALIPR